MGLPWAHREMGTMQMGQGDQGDQIGVAIVEGILLHTGGFPNEVF